MRKRLEQVDASAELVEEKDRIIEAVMAEGKQLSQQVLDQQAALRGLRQKLNEKEAELMQKSLRSFARPTPQRRRQSAPRRGRTT